MLENENNANFLALNGIIAALKLMPQIDIL